jgi:hypothetical protein
MSYMPSKAGDVTWDRVDPEELRSQARLLSTLSKSRCGEGLLPNSAPLDQ